MPNKVYLGNLNSSIEAKEIQVLVSEYGHVSDIIIKNAAENKTFAFVEFSRPEAAVLCAELMNGVCISGRPCVARNLDQNTYQRISNTIYISNIRSGIIKEQLSTVFSAFGDILTFKFLSLRRQYPSYAIIQWKSITDAKNAHKSMNNFKLAGSCLHIHYLMGDIPTLNRETIDIIEKRLQGIKC